MDSVQELKGHEILLGVTGGIAAYKSAFLASQLVQAGAGVSVVMTDSATQLIAPKTFEALTGRAVRVSMWESDLIHPHIDLSRRAELLCIAPATANIIGKAAGGIADDLLSTIILAFEGPVLMAPAMNSTMWNNPAVRRNCRLLVEDGIILIGPESGRLSCGECGAGRMVDPSSIFLEIKKCLLS